MTDSDHGRSRGAPSPDALITKMVNLAWELRCAQDGGRPTNAVWIEEVCRAAGLTVRARTVASQWRQGWTIPPPAVLFGIADVAGVSLDELRELARAALGQPARPTHEAAMDALVDELWGIVNQLLERVTQLESGLGNQVGPSAETGS